MAKLIYKPICLPMSDEELQKYLSDDVEYNPHYEHMKYSDIVREYKESGKHANFDYMPGGIEQLVKDFESGKISDDMFIGSDVDA